jgi:type IX secretion system PorP/SprF family membrane protein
MKKIFLACAVLISAIQMFGQQDPQFTQFMYDRLSVNPGFAGSQNAICATLLGRRQWAGFAGQPNTALLNVSAPIESIKSGVGASVYLDELGPLSTTMLRLSYAYHLKITGATKLGLGVSAGLLNSTMNNDWIAYNFSSDGVNQGIGTGAGDQSIPQFRERATTFDAAFGAYLYNPKYYVGLSATHLNQGNLDPMNIQVKRHLYLMGGYNFELAPEWVVTPHILAKTDLASTQFDANATVMYNNTLWVGVTYRLEDAIAPMAGYQYQFPNGKSTLKIGYSYDITASQLNQYSSGSHELMLRYCMIIEKPLPKRVYKNPRFL